MDNVAALRPRRPRIDCFVEDYAHEAFARALIARLAQEENLAPDVAFPSARGGKGRALSEFEAYQESARASLIPGGRPDLLVVIIDCDCKPRADCEREVTSRIDAAVFSYAVAGRPQSHIEAWFLADAPSFTRVVGSPPPPVRDECEPDIHKRRLEAAVRAGGNPVTGGGIEFAADLVLAMDLYRACRADASLSAFVSDLRAALRQIAPR